MPDPKHLLVPLGSVPLVVVLLVTVLLAAPPGAAPQEPTRAAWNDAHVLSLIARARDLRGSTAVDPEFRSYQAEARGYVYFYVDRADSAQEVLIKADQVALQLYWQAPNVTRQHIVGQRDKKVLPTDIRYHLDHLTVVQDDYGDFIRLGDGDEVEQVPHPVGPRAESAYDYLLADSLTLSYASGSEQVRVYEVQVRPKRMDRPGFVGTVFLDRERAAIVRMNFSFTPASYVDPYLDYIRITLDHSLWMGRWWLPYRQEVEIRREVPYFDFMAGSIIRSRFDVRGYDFNGEVPDALLRGPTVSAESPARRRAFQFERGLFDDLEETGGLGPSPSLEEVHAQVREVVQDEVMSGLSPVRLHLDQLSDFARYNRAEGIFSGGGVTVRPIGDWVARGTGGYAFGRRRGSATLRVGPDAAGLTATFEAYWDRLGDFGGHPGATMLENTISSASGSDDFLDPYFRRGGTVTLAQRPAGPLSLSIRWERQVGADDVVSDGPDTGFRPVRSIDEGTLVAASVEARRGLPQRGSLTVVPTVGRLADRSFASVTLDARWLFESLEGGWKGAASLAGGITNANAPAQSMFLLGGRHTLPGHPYRLFVGNAYWLANAEITVPVRPPWVGVRAIAAAGSTYLTNGVVLPSDWLARDSGGVRGSIGLGLSFGFDAMRFDVAHAIRGSGWEAIFSVSPQFRSWL